MTNDSDTDPDTMMALAWHDAAADAGGPHSSEPPATNPAGSSAGAATATPGADYADAWHAHDSYLDDASRWWNEQKQDHPVPALIASVAPVTGQITSGLELNDAYNKGDKPGMALAAAGLIPGGKLVVKGVKAIRAGHAMGQVAQIAHSGPAATAALKAGRAMQAKGAAQAAAGAGTETASMGSSIADYIDAWRDHK